MFIEEIKLIYTNFTAQVNQLLSKLFNDGVLIPEEKMPLIMVGISLFILLVFLSVWFCIPRRRLKNKVPHELSGRAKEKRLEQLEKERQVENFMFLRMVKVMIRTNRSIEDARTSLMCHKTFSAGDSFRLFDIN